MSKLIRVQRGLSIVELLVAMTISMLVVIAAAYTYLTVRESQRAIDRTSSSRETGTYVMQMLGREIMNAGFYPAEVATPGSPTNPSQQGMYDTYPPLDWQNPADPASLAAAFQSGIFGCNAGEFNVATSTCAAQSSNSDDPDTVVINYFTRDTKTMGGSASRRLDCTGNDVAPSGETGGDPTNARRRGGTDENIPPSLPVFVSNRFTLKTTRIAFDQFQKIETKSLVCSGNGKSPHGATNATAYQSIMAGLEDLQFTYGIRNGTATQFYKAADINGTAPLLWQNVTVVRVCLLTRTLGGNTRISDKAGAARKYRDCGDPATEKNQPAGDTITRYVEEFGLRNNMKQNY